MRRRTTPLFYIIVSLLLACGYGPRLSSGFSAVSPPRANGNSVHEFPEFNNLEPTAVQRVEPLSSSSSVTTNGVVSSHQLKNSNGKAAKTNKKKHAAIILNTNARSVSTDLVPIAESIFGKDYVYVTNTEEEGKMAAFQLMQEQDEISMVIPVGGDGTLSSMINFLCDAIREKNPHLTSIDDAMKELPLVAYVPLGTGNGVGSVVGSDMLSSPIWKIFGQKRRRLRQVQQVLATYQQVAQKLSDNPRYLSTDEARQYDVIDLPMMEVSYPDSKLHDDTLCFFAGAGFDSLMLQDFQSIKKWAIRTKILTKTLSSVAGYCVALVVKTLPKCVARQEHNIQVTVTTRDPDTLWVDHRRGDVVQSVGPTARTTKAAVNTDDDNNVDVDNDEANSNDETLLYQGSTGILAAGTSPFYGGGLRLFPFARLTKDKMHLRLGRIHPIRGFFNIPKIFEGSFRDKRLSSFGCLDFIGGDFDVRVSSTVTPPPTTNNLESSPEPQKGFPVQHSGESAGYFERFRLRVVKTPVRFLTLMEQRVVREEERES